MAFYDMTHSASFGWLRRSFGVVVQDIIAWREGRATLKALSKLTDSELYDIGLQRSDLDRLTGRGLRRG